MVIRTLPGPYDPTTLFIVKFKTPVCVIRKKLKNLQSELFNNTLNNIPFLFFVLNRMVKDN